MKSREQNAARRLSPSSDRAFPSRSEPLSYAFTGEKQATQKAGTLGNRKREKNKAEARAARRGSEPMWVDPGRPARALDNLSVFSALSTPLVMREIEAARRYLVLAPLFLYTSRSFLEVRAKGLCRGGNRRQPSLSKGSGAFLDAR